ncbi:MAG: hypothetical protein ABI648_16270 [Betaproteobacteria bacterium]|jgi:hypothetical protein
MTNIISRRWIITAAAIFLLLAATGVAAMHLAAQLLRTSIEHTLGPEIHYDSLRVGLASIELTGVEVAAPQGWPAVNSFRAQRVLMVPDLRDPTSGNVVIDRVTIQGAYISAVGRRDGGGIRILPGILDQPGIAVRKEWARNRPSRGAVVGTVEFADCTIDLYDSERSGTRNMCVDDVNGVIEDVAVPKLAPETLRELKVLITGAERRAGIAARSGGDVVKTNTLMGSQSPENSRSALRPYY